MPGDTLEMHNEMTHLLIGHDVLCIAHMAVSQLGFLQLSPFNYLVEAGRFKHDQAIEHSE